MKEKLSKLLQKYLWPSTVIFIGVLWAIGVFVTNTHAARLKDIAEIEGVRSNQLIGYGLVVGLNGTGDSDKTQFTVQSLVSMMERLGVAVDRSKIKVDNVAAVVVTATLPPFTRTGNSIDVLVSSVGDAESLVGGTLLMTPMKGPDGSIYAVAQGPVVVGSIAFAGASAKAQKNHPTVGRIPSGAFVEKTLPFELGEREEIIYRLKDADFTTAERITLAINVALQSDAAKAIDSGNVSVLVPREKIDDIVAFVSNLESIEVVPDTTAKIVVNERTGTIVMGEQVRISTVAVSHGNLNIIIGESQNVSQPQPFTFGRTSIPIPETSLSVHEDAGNLVVMKMGASIGDIAKTLNAIGATPRDLIAILQSIKAAGALHADLEVI